MDYLDDYYEPSDFNIAMEEFKQSIIDNVRKELKEKVEKLEHENAELQEVKRNWNELKKEHDDALYELKRKTENVERELARKKAKDLLSKLALIGYMPSIEYHERPKCDKCDEKRKIHFISPMGRKMVEDCDCAKRICVYNPQKVKLQRFSVYDEKIYSVYYKLNENEYCDQYTSHNVCSELPDDLSKLNRYSNVFLTEEDCQKYCDFLNKEET